MSTTRRAFLGGAAFSSLACRKRDRRPNVVVIMTDDQRADCLGVAGHPFLRTPHLDRIANEGARFSNAFVTTSLCSPSRASFLSGAYAHTHRVLNNFTDFPASQPGYSRALDEAGYETAYIGKWHMGEGNDAPRPGFDYWASHKGQGKYYDTEFNINGTRQVLTGYYTHRVTDLAVDWLRGRGRAPFLLILGHKAPHGAWTPEPKYEHIFDQIPAPKPASASHLEGKPSWVHERIKTWHGIEGPLYGTNDFGRFIRSYHATIPSVDDSVGQVYEALRRSGELDNTILVFTSDNGFLLGEHASIDKRTMWEESIRIPMLVRFPELIRSPVVRKEMVLNIDLAPSLVDLCGARELPAAHGESWRPLLEGDSSDWRKSFLYEYNFETEFPYTPNVRGVRTDDWKYVHYPNGEGQTDTYSGELYHLSTDPGESRNLINEKEAAPKLAELKTELARLQTDSGASPDAMPANPVLRMEMPAQSIR